MAAVVMEPQTVMRMAAMIKGTRTAGKLLSAIMPPMVAMASFSRRMPPMAPPIAVMSRAPMAIWRARPTQLFMTISNQELFSVSLQPVPSALAFLTTLSLRPQIRQPTAMMPMNRARTVLPKVLKKL